MGWKGTIRSLAATARAAEKEAQRRGKQQLKEQMHKVSASAVEDWEDYVHDLVSIHTDMADIVDWHAIANQSPPSAPMLSHINQDRVESALIKFKPSIFHVFRGGPAKLRSQLEAQVDEAAALDQFEYQHALAIHSKKVEEWEEDTTLAHKLLEGDAASIRRVVAEMQSLSNTGLIGSGIEFAFDKNFIHATLRVHGDDIVPDTRRKQLASGRLSETKMPTGQFNELYQDYVASAAIKVAGDLFHILPLNEVYVTCETNMLNSQSGHMEWAPILSVQFVRESLMSLNLANIDPSDALKNFRHQMIFGKTKGFSPIEPLKRVPSNNL